jgi:hypothetical protein
MRTKVVAAVTATAALSLLTAGGASAEEQHGSCQAAGQFAAGLAQGLGSGFGQIVSSLAQAGAADDFVHTIHAAFCEPRP